MAKVAKKTTTTKKPQIVKAASNALVKVANISAAVFKSSVRDKIKERTLTKEELVALYLISSTIDGPTKKEMALFVDELKGDADHLIAGNITLKEVKTDKQIKPEEISGKAPAYIKMQKTVAALEEKKKSLQGDVDVVALEIKQYKEKMLMLAKTDSKMTYKPAITKKVRKHYTVN